MLQLFLIICVNVFSLSVINKRFAHFFAFSFLYDSKKIIQTIPLYLYQSTMLIKLLNTHKSYLFSTAIFTSQLNKLLVYMCLPSKTSELMQIMHNAQAGLIKNLEKSGMIIAIMFLRTYNYLSIA